MKKQILFFLIGLFFSSLSYSQKIKPEFQIASGFETGFSNLKITDTESISSSLTYAMQINFQLLFNKVGFMLSYENSTRNYQTSVINSRGEEVIFTNPTKTNRFMINFVGRITPIKEKLFVDLRFGVGSLLNTPKKVSYNFIGSNVHLNNSRRCWDFGVKTHYRFSKRVAVYMDAALTLTPYTYLIKRDHILFSYSEYKSSYQRLFGLSIGLSFNIAKMK